jgi:secreted trypsin-like serine protease
MVRRLFVLGLIFGTVWLGTPGSATVGGRPATERYPFMVSVQDSESDRHFCGGSLVRRDWVLTAGHCAIGSKPKEIQVMLGSQKLSKPKDVSAIDAIHVNPTYKKEGIADAALLHLALRANQDPIRIAKPSQSKSWAPGTNARALGWGQDAFFVGQSPDMLHEVDVPVVSDEDCSRSYTVQGGFDAATMLCAGEQVGGKDTCQGDSGGPLMVQNDRKEWVLIGATSWGTGCGFPTFYGVYAEVAGKNLTTWINRVLP